MAEQPTASLSRELTLFQLTMMGVGMMIGAGAVIGMGHSVAIAGPGGTLLAFALDGIVALFTAFSYAEMSSAIPKAGSIYNFGRIAFGRGVGFTAGWMAWFASSVAGSFYAVICAEYLMDLGAKLGMLDWLPLAYYWRLRVAAVLLALLFVFINYRGVSSTGKTAGLLTLGQTATLGLIGLYGVVVFLREPARLANFTPFVPKGWSAILVCMGLEYIAFEGYEVIAEAGDEAIEPRRNLPKAILYSVLIVTFTYVIVAFSLITGVHDVGRPAWEWLGSFGERGFGEAMAQLMPLGSFLAVLTVVFAATSALNSTIFSAARVSYALGRDHMLPAIFGSISRRRSTPHMALVGTTVLVVACILLPITDIASASSIMFLFLFLLANLCVIRLRHTMGNELEYGFLMPLFPLIPAAAIVLQLVLAIFIVNVSWLAWVIAPAWILVGLLVFLTYSRSRATPIREEILTLEETRAPTGKGPHILLPLLDAERTLPLVPHLARIAAALGGTVDMLHLVAIPDQVPLSDAALHTLPGHEAMAEAGLYLSWRADISSSTLYCRNPARGILYQVRARHTDLVILGWRGDTRPIGFVFGRTLDTVLMRAQCDVAIIRPGSRSSYLRILVPIAGGPNGEHALAMAAAVADPSRGSITALHVRREGRRMPDLERSVASVCARTGFPRDRVATRVLTSSDPRGAILGEARDADLLVLGATRSGRWARALRLSLPEEVALGTDTPLVIVRARRRSLLPRRRRNRGERVDPRS